MRLPLAVTIALAAAICATPIAASPAGAGPITTPPYGATWTVDTAANSLTEYAPSASGAATPIATISGAATDLAGPTAVAVGSKGNVYVADADSNSITEYAFGTQGDVAPIEAISGPVTGLDAPSSLALVGGQVWVTDPATNVVEAFSAGSTGNVLPAETIHGAKTHLNHPIAITVNNDLGLGFITVLNAPTSGHSSITTYFALQYGNIAPLARVLGAKGHPLVSPTAMASGGFGLVWVADSGTNSLTELFAIANGLPAIATIKGAATKLDAPDGLSIDALNQLVVANGGDHSLRVFASRARGDVAPIRSITAVGSDTSSPSAVSVIGAPPGAPTAVHAVAHNASATVSWKAPTATGGGVLGYDVTAISRRFFEDPSGGEILSNGAVGFTTNKKTFTLHHLKNGRKYFFEIQAVNAFGESSAGRSNPATPLTLPGAPRQVIAVGGDHSLTVGWTRPAQNGGKRITHYRVEYATCSPRAIGCAFHSRLVAGVRRRTTISGLTAATKYHVRLIAQSSIGAGRPSKETAATTS